MLTFTNPISTYFGAKQLANLLQRDLRRQATQAEPDEQHRLFEQANQIRDLMTFPDLFMTAIRLGR